ncbi:BnaC09g31920D [Brassica napus]|uniref:BnaC09g31920D protein n=1 Tax=Brassica napus TaxID=3708 RepID=A0A078G3J3_BRANA|nr:BnaC09g31920D [Brassica napus]
MEEELRNLSKSAFCFLFFLCSSLLCTLAAVQLFSSHGSQISIFFSSLLIKDLYVHFPQIYAASSALLNEPMPEWVFAVKVLVFGVLLHVYEYKDVLPRFVVLALYCLHIYLEVELVLVFVGAVVSTLLGCDIEPVFNEPYLATSLQDFWSRRWNLMVSAVLRSAVHIPVQPNIAVLVGVMASFLVSGLMHELIYFYAIRLPPTWEVTCFFVLQGVATTSEIVVKRTLRWTPPHRAVSGLAVMAFVSVTGVWLFLPQLLRNNVHERATSECLLVIDFAKRKLFISSS